MKRKMQKKREELRKQAVNFGKRADWCRMVACDYYLAGNFEKEQYWEREVRRYEALERQTRDAILRLYARYQEDKLAVRMANKKREATAKVYQTHSAVATQKGFTPCILSRTFI